MEGTTMTRAHQMKVLALAVSAAVLVALSVSAQLGHGSAAPAFCPIREPHSHVQTASASNRTSDTLQVLGLADEPQSSCR